MSSRNWKLAAVVLVAGGLALAWPETAKAQCRSYASAEAYYGHSYYPPPPPRAYVRSYAYAPPVYVSSPVYVERPYYVERPVYVAPRRSSSFHLSFGYDSGRHYRSQGSSHRYGGYGYHSRSGHHRSSGHWSGSRHHGGRSSYRSPGHHGRHGRH